MERTPKNKFSHKLNHLDKYESSLPESTSNDAIKTPIQTKLSQYENDYSPLYIQQTQETLDQLDVVWDWNSPQSKYKQKHPVQKRPHSYQSPKQVKRHPSNNQIESYDKLKNELEALKHELVESRGNEKSSSKALFKDIKDEKSDDLKDLESFFDDDSLEEEMILQSQKIEQLLTMEIKNNTCDITDVQNVKSSEINTSSKFELGRIKSTSHIKSLTVTCEMVQNSDVTKPHSSEYKQLMENEELNDDFLWKSFTNNEAIDKLENNKEFISKRTDTMCNKKTDEVETNKTCSLKDIEEKRLQALAKLKAKKSHSVLLQNITSVQQEQKESNFSNKEIYKDEVSPIRCSPEEIEQKRLHALAKLQEKKKQEKIEKNRQEALRRLEMNKKKRALQNLSNQK